MSKRIFKSLREASLDSANFLATGNVFKRSEKFRRVSSRRKQR